MRGLALAYLGRKDEAIRRASAPWRSSDPRGMRSRARTCCTSSSASRSTVGEHEKALDQLEALLKIPYFLTPGWLKIDPNFDPLRKNPRFQKLVAGAK